MLGSRPSFVAEAEFLSRQETLERTELLDGEVLVSPAPSWGHQRLVGLVYAQLAAWAATAPEPFTAGLAPCDIRFATARILQPDVFVLRGALPRRTPVPLDVIPVLCVEVLSPGSVEHDRRTKRLAYAQAGVAEYWVVADSADDASPTVEQFVGPGLFERRDWVGEVVAHTLPGLRVVLS